MRVYGLVLAAGMSKRMKEFKPLMRIDGRTMIETTVSHMLEAGISSVTVVVGYRGEEVEAVLRSMEGDGRELQIVFNPDYETTQMLDSIQIGLAAMGECDGYFLTPGDMPAISSDTYRKMITLAEKSAAKVIFPVLEGHRKHPPFIRSECTKRVLEFQGEGIRELWKEYEGETLEVPVEDQGCSMDADYQNEFQRICDYIKGAR